MGNLIKNLATVFGKYIPLAIILFITGELYYSIYEYGIDSFYHPMAGIFIAIFLPIIAVVYYLFFIRTPKK